jgi:hypothetical protein
MLKDVVHANCRSQFTADDFSFVVSVLSKSPRDAVSLVSLLSDEEERDSILDHDLIYASLVDQTGCLRVSAAFYFYVLTRRVLRRVSLDERALTDYVAAVLLAFSRTNQLAAGGAAPASARSFTYMSDMLTRLDGCAPGEAYFLRTHLADYALFLSGMFADRVAAHAQRRGAPGLGFYEAIGQASYLDAARHPQAKRADLGLIFQMLGSEFRRVRIALNDLTDTLLHLHVPPVPGIIRPS